MNNNQIPKGTLREFALVTLSHAEKRNLNPEEIALRLRNLFRCVAIVIAKEFHQENGYHFHAAIHTQNASKNSAIKVIRMKFTEFEGFQCNVKFFKGWGALIKYTMKQDREPYVWGKYSLQEIINIGEMARTKKRIDTIKPVEAIFQHLHSAEKWYDVYQNSNVRERLIYGSYSNFRSIFDDVQVLKQIEKDPLKRIEIYISEKQKEIGEIEEYSPEEIKEKYILLDWIACNIAFQRPLKTKQLFLYGPPSTQKTLIFYLLRKVLRIYFASSRINDFAGADDYYDLWLFDEFHQIDDAISETANAHYNTLLKVLDGQECRLDAKYSRVFNKTRNVPIVLIANKIPSKAREYGPFQERLLRLRFFSNIEQLQEERIIATLKGCILRRIGNNVLKKTTHRELKYNLDNIGDFLAQDQIKQIIKAANTEKEGIPPVFTSTSSKDFIQLQLMKSTLQSKYREIEYFYFKFVFKRDMLPKNELSIIPFALIPLRKSQNPQAEGYNKTLIPVFHSKRVGGNFYIIRNSYSDEPDYITWPLRVALINQTQVWTAQIDYSSGEPKMSDKEREDNLRNIENFFVAQKETSFREKTHPYNDLQITLDTLRDDLSHVVRSSELRRWNDDD